MRWAIAALAALTLCACGNDEQPKHGLQREELASRPTGDGVEVVYGAEDGAVYVARVTIRMQIRQKRDGKTKSAEGMAVVEVRQAFQRPDPKRAPRSRIEFVYKQAEGVKADAYLKRELISGTLEHDDDGRAKPRSLALTGGTKAEQLEARDLLGALMFAGFGGSPSWIPPRPVRRGEAWQLEAFVRPQALDNIATQARSVGLQVPNPTFSGTARLEAVRDGAAGRELEVSLDALLEIEGTIRQDGGTGHMSIGDRVRGRATISAATGLPTAFRVTHSGSKRIRSGDQEIDQSFTSEVEGQVSRLDGE